MPAGQRSRPPKRLASNQSTSRHQHIAQVLRTEIRNGTWQPGERLATVRDLCVRHEASLLTVHRALRELADLGFITTHGRHGTLVAEHPPHRCRFGLVLPELPDSEGHYSHLRWAALARAAKTFTQPQRVVEIFHAVGPHPELLEHRRLSRAIADQRLAGVIMPSSSPGAWLDLDRYHLPIIGGDVATPAHPHRGGLHLVQLDFLDAALDQVVLRKLTKVGAILHAGAAAYGGERHLIDAAAARGLTIPAHRVLGVDPLHPVWTTNAVQALLQGQPALEVLIIADDHLVDPALRVLRDLPRKRPVIMVQANLPVTSSLAIPCVQIGWDHHHFLNTALDHLSRHLTTGEPVGDHHLPVHITGKNP